MNTAFRVALASCFATMLMPFSLHAEVIWRCYSFFDFRNSEVLLTVSGDIAKQTGVIEFAGNEQTAIYYLQGLNQRWDFGLNGNFSFLIRPDGAGFYYDFTTVENGEAKKPSQSYRCSEFHERVTEEATSTVSPEPKYTDRQKEMAKRFIPHLGLERIKQIAENDEKFAGILNKTRREVDLYFQDEQDEIDKIQAEALSLLGLLEQSHKGGAQEQELRRIQQDIDNLSSKIEYRRSSLEAKTQSRIVGEFNRAYRATVFED